MKFISFLPRRKWQVEDLISQRVSVGSCTRGKKAGVKAAGPSQIHASQGFQRLESCELNQLNYMRGTVLQHFYWIPFPTSNSRIYVCRKWPCFSWWWISLNNTECLVIRKDNPMLKSFIYSFVLLWGHTLGSGLGINSKQCILGFPRGAGFHPSVQRVRWKPVLCVGLTTYADLQVTDECCAQATPCSGRGQGHRWRLNVIF